MREGGGEECTIQRVAAILAVLNDVKCSGTSRRHLRGVDVRVVLNSGSLECPVYTSKIVNYLTEEV